MKSVAIIGAGPAGLSAAYTLLNQADKYCVTIFEKDSVVGGLSKTFTFEGGRIDIGGHRFFTKNEDVLNLWEAVLPHGNRGMLVRDRKSHILWDSKLIDYPVQLNAQTIKSLGVVRGVKVVASYIASAAKKRHIHTLEEFYIHRFGSELYSMFFENYTQKLWGIPASKISSNWGEQRVQKISLAALICSMFLRKGSSKSDERSLLAQYHYPAYGSGQLWDGLCEKIKEYGGKVETNCVVDRLTMEESHITSIEYIKNSERHAEKFDYVISSMPISELIECVEDTPREIKQVGNRLFYRDMIVAGIELPRDYMGPIFHIAKKDSWLYMQDVKMTFGRVQILNNWSPYSVTSSDSVLLELEFFCSKGDLLWEMDEEKLIQQSLRELTICGLCEKTVKATSYIVKRIEKAYPVYTEGYYQLKVVENWVDGIENLRCVGRNGQHCYNNMDHSVETGIEAAKSILDEDYDRRRLWSVNRNQEYLEK